MVERFRKFVAEITSGSRILQRNPSKIVEKSSKISKMGNIEKMEVSKKVPKYPDKIQGYM